MPTLGRRVLGRAVPVGIVSALLGYALLQGYLLAVREIAKVEVQTDGPSYLAPLILGAAGFAIMAALECVRRPTPPPTA